MHVSIQKPVFSIPLHPQAMPDFQKPSAPMSASKEVVSYHKNTAHLVRTPCGDVACAQQLLMQSMKQLVQTMI